MNQMHTHRSLMGRGLSGRPLQLRRSGLLLALVLLLSACAVSVSGADSTPTATGGAGTATATSGQGTPNSTPTNTPNNSGPTATPTPPLSQLTVYVGTANSTFYGINASNGAKRWQTAV